METSFPSLIQAAKSVLILLPSKPYFDQVAAGLSLYLALRDKTNATVSCPSPMVVEFNRMVGVNKIVSEVGNKDLTMKFSGYPATNIEKVSYDIEDGEFKLMVVPKPGFASPKKEEVNFEYSGVSADTIILIGGANESHFPAIAGKGFEGAKLIHLGIRNLDLGGKAVMSFAKPASSVSELVAGLLKQAGYTLDTDIATNLVMGIEEGSGHFTGPEVNADTFQTFAELLRIGGQRISQQKIEKPVFPQGLTGEGVREEAGIEKVEKKEAPKDWLEPKIFKGTSVS